MMKSSVIFRYSQDSNNLVFSIIVCMLFLLILIFLLFLAIKSLSRIKHLAEFKYFYTWIPIIAIVIIICLAVPIIKYLIPSAEKEIKRFYYEDHSKETITGILNVSDFSVYMTREKQYYLSLKIGEETLYPATSFTEEGYNKIINNQGSSVIVTLITNDGEIGDPVVSDNDKLWNYNCVVLKIIIIDKDT